MEDARLAFVEAAKEIDVYVAEKTRAAVPPRSARNKVNDSAFSEMENADFPVVKVETGTPGEARSITSVMEAEAFLLTEWPGKRARLHGLARQACLDAMDGNTDADLARNVFIEAAKDANIYIAG